MDSLEQVYSNSRDALKYTVSSHLKPERSTGQLENLFEKSATDEEKEKLIVNAREKYIHLRNGRERKESENTPPQVSVVVPIYVKEDSSSVMKLVGSLLNNENAPPTEIIAVFNGPDEETYLEDNELKKTLDKIGIKTIYKKINPNETFSKKIFTARQAGLEATEGRHILNVDADCVVEKTWIKNLSKQLTITPFAYGAVQSIPTTKLIAENTMISISIIAKAGKILTGMGAYQGGNHAFDKDTVLAVTERPYEIAEKNVEIPNAISNLARKKFRVGFVNGAGVIAPFGYAERSSSSWDLVTSYFTFAINKNVDHIKNRIKMRRTVTSQSQT